MNHDRNKESSAKKFHGNRNEQTSVEKIKVSASIQTDGAWWCKIIIYMRCENKIEGANKFRNVD